MILFNPFLISRDMFVLIRRKTMNLMNERLYVLISKPNQTQKQT